MTSIEHQISLCKQPQREIGSEHHFENTVNVAVTKPSNRRSFNKSFSDS